MARSYHNGKKNPPAKLPKLRKAGKQLLVALLEGGEHAIDFFYYLSDRRQESFEEFLDRDRRNTYRILKRLERDKLIRLKKQREKITARLTDEGLRAAERIAALSFPSPKTDRWDGIWRMVIFDIPESQRPVRDVLRDVIKEHGFKQMQKSVFITPWPCKAMITKIQEIYQAHKNIKYLELSTFDDQEEFKKIFDL